MRTFERKYEVSTVEIAERIHEDLLDTKSKRLGLMVMTRPQITGHITGARGKATRRLTRRVSDRNPLSRRVMIVPLTHPPKSSPNSAEPTLPSAIARLALPTRAPWRARSLRRQARTARGSSYDRSHQRWQGAHVLQPFTQSTADICPISWL